MTLSPWQEVVFSVALVSSVRACWAVMRAHSPAELRRAGWVLLWSAFWNLLSTAIFGDRVGYCVAMFVVVIVIVAMKRGFRRFPK